ncbi:MAG: hypothetical protein H6656_02530 [Ardenticatenaceae bacterium]|nr:hypothetical protein [Ardenticatenaceae bacterium]
MGGVAVIELVLSQVIVLVSAVTFALWGLYSSSRMRTTLAASVVTFAGALFITVGVPVIVGLFSMILSPFFAGAALLSWQAEAGLMYLLMVLAATNLPATLLPAILCWWKKVRSGISALPSAARPVPAIRSGSFHPGRSF